MSTANPVAAEASGRYATAVAGTLMLVAVGLHVAAMFPAYPGDPPAAIVSLPHDIAMYVCLEVGWAVAAVLVFTRAHAAGGAALALGLGMVEACLLASDMVTGFMLGTPSSGGIWLAVAGLLTGFAGILVVASEVPLGTPRLPSDSRSTLRAGVTAVVGVVAVVTFWLSWQTGHVVSTTGQVSPINGNAFDQPLQLVVPAVAAGAAIGLVVIAAAYWSPLEVGGWAMLGAVTALASQLVTGWAQVIEPLRDAVNDGSATGLDVARSTISLTPDWAVNVAAALALFGLAIWALADGARARQGDRASGEVLGTQASDEPSWPTHQWPVH